MLRLSQTFSLYISSLSLSFSSAFFMLFLSRRQLTLICSLSLSLDLFHYLSLWTSFMEDGIMNGNQGQTIQTRITHPTTPRYPSDIAHFSCVLCQNFNNHSMRVGKSKRPRLGSIQLVPSPTSTLCFPHFGGYCSCLLFFFFFFLGLFFFKYIYMYTFMSDIWGECFYPSLWIDDD